MTIKKRDTGTTIPISRCRTLYPIYGIQTCLYIEEEVHYISILDYIILSFDTELSCCSAGRLRLELNKILILDDLGTDESLFEVSVDDSGRLRSLVTFIDGPCTAFICSGSEICAEIKEGICTLDESYNS